MNSSQVEDGFAVVKKMTRNVPKSRGDVSRYMRRREASFLRTNIEVKEIEESKVDKSNVNEVG